METTMQAHKITEMFNSLRKAIRRGDVNMGAKLVKDVLDIDATRTWSFLLTAASSEVSYMETWPKIFVHDMYDNWDVIRNPIFAVDAVLGLCRAPKGTSAGDFISRRTD